MKKIAYLLLLAATVAFFSCGDDDTNPGGGSTGTPPNINMKVGSVYTFNIDSIQTSGNVVPTRYITKDSIMTQGSFFGQTNVFQIRAETKDSTIPGPSVVDTFYVRYEGGKFYQYGVIQLLDPSITPTWDLIGDFSVAAGTVWNIATGINIQIGSFPATANITGKIAADTTFHTTGWGNLPVNCFRSEIVADIFISGIPAGKVYVDYYIGDADPASNPSGLVRLKLRPFNISGILFAGVDQRMKKWVIP